MVKATGIHEYICQRRAQGYGRYIHEFPSLSPRSDAILEVGNVVTVEPGIYVEGKYGLRIEDMVAVTEGGILNFTKSSKELIELF